MPTEVAISASPQAILAIEVAGPTRVQAWPRYLRLAAIITALFGLVVASISLIIGTPPDLPDERAGTAPSAPPPRPIGT